MDDENPLNELGTYEMACLTGSRRAVGASLAGLRAVGAVAIDAGPRLRVSGPLPADAHALDQEIHRFLEQHPGADVHDVTRDSGVRRELTTIEANLTATGLTSIRRRLDYLLIALGCLLLAPILGGLAWWLFGTTALLLCLAALLAVFVSAALQLRTVQRVKMGAVDLLQREHPHLAPVPGMSWGRDGQAAALTVALYGIPALRIGDPRLAKAMA